MRRLFPFIGASLALALLVSLAFAPAADARAPRFVEGLDQTARVIYDQDGTPHIYAATDADAYFMLGYVHAQDRYFQMDTLRRQFSGTLAEVLGPANPRIAELRRHLGRRSSRSDDIVLEGPRTVGEALDAGLELRTVIVPESGADDPTVARNRRRRSRRPAKSSRTRSTASARGRCSTN